MKEPLLLSLIPLAFNEDLEGEIQTFSLFAEKEDLLQILWDLLCKVHSSTPILNFTLSETLKSIQKFLQLTFKIRML